MPSWTKAPPVSIVGFPPPAVLAETGSCRVPGMTRSRTCRRTVGATILGGAIAFSGLSAQQLVQRWLTVSAPPLPSVDFVAALSDDTVVAATITVDLHRIEWPTTADDLRTNITLWRSMHVADWNRIPEPILEQSLDNMIRRYRRLVATPSVWDAMTAADWDLVPQPIRTLAYRNMMAYWSGYYHVGGAYGHPPRLVADTLSALVMSESWFDHRGVLVNGDGTRDLGLGGTSDFARRRMRELYLAGVVDVALDDADYENPWMATRFVAIWMRLLLDEAAGDLDRAVGAYHRGSARANDERGTRYLVAVRQRRATFMRNVNAPPAWAYLWRRGREIEREQWAWLGPEADCVEDALRRPFVCVYR